MGGCFSTPSKSSRRRRRSKPKYRCAPVQYEYYYSVRDSETVLVRRRVGDSRRHQTEDSSSLDMNLVSGRRSRHHKSSGRRKYKKKRKGGSSSHRRSKSGRSSRYGSGGHRSHETRSGHEDEEWDAEERRNQVAFWARESTRGHDRASSQGVGGQENQGGSRDGESADENVSSLHENDEGKVDDEPEVSSGPKKS